MLCLRLDSLLLSSYHHRQKLFFSILLLALISKEGSWPLLITGVHWEAKYELKSSIFSAKFETTLSSARIGGTMGVSLLLKNLFKIDQ